MHHLKRSFFPSLAIALICAAEMMMLSADARACSPPAPALTSHIPADGAWYPANGILLFDGYSISLDQVTVSVMGANGSSSAMLVDASSAFKSPVAALAARVSPKPNPEDKVTIKGSFCPGCPSETFTFTARADDLVAPEGVVNAHYAVHDYADFKSSGGDCQSDSDLGLWVHAQTIPASEEEAPTILQIEAFADSALSKPLASNAGLITSNEFVWGYRTTLANLQGANPTSVCFRLSTKDLSGNDAAEPTVVCNACYARTDAQGTMGLPPDEPKWGEAETIKGGPCDWSAGVGGGPSDDASCSVRAIGSAGKTASWLLVFAAAFGLRTARKRARK